MSFLKKHYEKIVLTIFLIIFIVALIWQIGIITSSSQVTREQLRIPRKRPDYVSVNFTEQYNTVAALTKDSKWLRSGPRKKDDKIFTDLTTAIKIARCPYCEKLIPSDDFYVFNQCSICGKKLEKPKKLQDVVTFDSDEDGIPDKIERESGMNPADPDDLYEDADGDGFNNYVEFKRDMSGKSINDPKLHPSLALQLSVERIKRTKIPLRLKKVVKRGDQKKNWEIHVDVRGRRGWRTRFPKLNDIIKVGDEAMKIIDINYMTKDRFDRSTNTTRKIDVSEITLQKVDELEKIVAVVGKSVYEPKEQIYVKNIVTGKTYKLAAGKSFKVGNRKVGIENFTVERVLKSKKNTIKIKRDDGKFYKVKQQSPEEVRPERRSLEERKRREGAPPGMPPGMPPELMEELRKGKDSKRFRKNR